MKEPSRRCQIPVETVRRIYMSSGSDAEVARKEGYSRQTVARIREGIDWADETMWLPAGDRPTKAYDECKFPTSDEEMMHRLAIASCLKAKHKGGDIMQDENINTLLPIG